MIQFLKDRQLCEGIFLNNQQACKKMFLLSGTQNHNKRRPLADRRPPSYAATGDMEWHKSRRKQKVVLKHQAGATTGHSKPALHPQEEAVKTGIRALVAAAIMSPKWGTAENPSPTAEWVRGG
jgi:hypothetical protein